MNSFKQQLLNSVCIGGAKRFVCNIKTTPTKIFHTSTDSRVCFHVWVCKRALQSECGELTSRIACSDIKMPKTHLIRRVVV